MNLFRGHRVSAITIGAPQQQQIAQALQPGRRTRLNHGIGALGVQFHRGDYPDRIPFRETTAETGGHQHVADANIGIRRQMLKLEIVRAAVTGGSDFAAGANIDGKHYFGINWDRDVATPEVADIRNVVAGDPSPDGKGTLLIKRGIEVGHIFQLGTKYSEAMKAAVQGEDGRNQILTMGCYGIGVTRVVAAAIEQNFDDRGIVWPDAIAPFQVAILPMNMHKSYRVQELAEKLYAELSAQGIEVLMDDRKERPGVMFADMELIGIPHTIVLGDRNLDNDDIEYKYRRNGEKQLIKTGDIVEYLVKAIKG